MDTQTRRRPHILLSAAVVSAFLLGSLLIDALLPGGMRNAMLLTLPGDTGSFVTDYAPTVYQALVLGVGAIMGVRLSRRDEGSGSK